VEARIEVRLRPRSYRDELLGMRDGVLEARVRAAPVDGKANEALRRLLAKRLGVAPSRLRLLRGETARRKLIAVAGLDQPALDARLRAM
jgi:uncharacterized protein